MLGQYAALVSDVQVTFGDGRTADMLRKAYPVGPYIVGAFAGSVYIGFALLQSLADALAVPADAPGNAAWEPNTVAEWWGPNVARPVFQGCPQQQRELGAQFLLVGAHPTEDNGIPGCAVPYLCRFSWPEFRPEIVRNGNSALSIGSGANIARYADSLKSMLDPRNGMLQAEVGNIGGWGRVVGFHVNRVVREHAVAGISSHVHIHLALRSSIELLNSDMNEYRGDERVEVRMPRVAQNYAQFEEMATELRADIATAVC